MTTFTINLAGVPVAVSAQFESTRSFCRDYLTEEPAQIEIRVDPADLRHEAERSARENIREGLPVRQYPEEYLETLAVYRKIAERMVEHGVFLFHGSAVAVDGEAFLFTAKSGTGKSTHTRLWRQQFGSRAVMVNDDKPLLRITGDGVLVCGTPWDGKHHLSTNVAVPLRSVCILERGAENQIRPVTAQEALPMLLQQCQRPTEPGNMAKFLGLISDLTKKVGLFRLACNMDPEAALVAYHGMKGTSL